MPFIEVYNSAKETIYYMGVLDRDELGQCPKGFIIPEAAAAAEEDKLKEELKEQEAAQEVAATAE